MTLSTPKRRSLIVACAFAITATVALAVDEVQMSFEAAKGANWSASGLTAAVALDGGTRASLRIENLQVDGLPEPLTDVRIECPQLEISTRAFGCKGAQVSVHMLGLGAQRMRADLVYGRADESVEFNVAGIKIGAGSASIRGQLLESGWNAAAKLEGVPLESLHGLARRAKLEVPLASAAGFMSLDLEAHGNGAAIQAANARGHLSELTANNESGSVATDRFAFQFAADVRRVAQDWQYEMEVIATGGQVYVQPIFLDFGVHNLTASARGGWDSAGKLTAQSFSISHAEVLQTEGSAEVDFAHEQPLRALKLERAALEFPGAYESYLQPLLLDTNFKALVTKGKLVGALLLHDGAPEDIDLHFQKLSVDDGRNEFALRDLNGHWQWRASAAASQQEDEDDSRVPVPQSELQWSAGMIFGLPLGASGLRFSTEGQNFRLLEPSRIPLVDGAIQLESLRVRNAGSPKVAFMIDAVVLPISVQRLCQAFGWPEFGGQIGGAISKLRMREGVVTLGTTLEAQVFDGFVTVKDLRLEQPFGKWPRFYSSIALKNLDLELLTGAFSFGRITGRLSGAIDALELFNWAPIAFDAQLYTPPDDRSRHRISQRAVQNIGSIGGGGAGITAALSSGVLRFFDDFNYARLGISCRLHNEICEMGGVGPAPNGGYYLVQGRGLPRIDVIGNSRRVDWPRLVQQLIAATESGGPIVD